MRIPDQSIIEKTLDNEATPEEAREVVHWFKTPEGQAWLAKRMDVSADRAPASSPAYTPSYCVCGSHFDTGGLVYRSFHAC